MSSRYLPADNPDYLSRQLITYLGNKRALLPHIDSLVCDNPRCITSTEQELAHIFKCVEPKQGIYRCIYCESKTK